MASSEKSKEYGRRYYHEHKEAQLKGNKAYREKHKEELKIKNKQRNTANPERIKAYTKQYNGKNRERDKLKYQNNKEKEHNRNKLYRHSERGIQKHKEYYEKNRIKINKRRNDYDKKKCKTDPEYKLKRRLRARLYETIKVENKTDHFVIFIGCSISFLKEHIESLFQEGMTWENYGYGNDKWHVDHIKPCACFNMADPIQVKECFNWSNLQPLWQPDNLKKGSRLVA